MIYFETIVVKYFSVHVQRFYKDEKKLSKSFSFVSVQ